MGLRDYLPCQNLLKIRPYKKKGQPKTMALGDFSKSSIGMSGQGLAFIHWLMSADDSP